MINAPESEKVFSISEITKAIKRTLETRAEFNNIWVRGEIYNLTFHSSGHIYFTLKDEGAILSAVFFRYANKNCSFKLKEGMSIFACGSITVFEKRGSYQINISQVRQDGLGELQARIIELKQKLLREGIFDAEQKKELPLIPMRIGIVTSPTGAALRDIVKVALRRYPNIEIVIAPALVQGDRASESIVAAIKELNKPEYRIDVIIAGRGGGSFEDLMPFNEETVVRAFYHSRVPIVSAVGHQIDHPLCDESADHAVPTPSAAAEIVVPLKQDLVEEIEYYYIRMHNAVDRTLTQMRTIFAGIMTQRSFRDPFEIILYREMALSDLQNRLMQRFLEKLVYFRDKFYSIADISLLLDAFVKDKKHRLLMAMTSLEQLSPLGVMRRGYAMVLHGEDVLVRHTNEASVGEMIKVLISDGTFHCIIESIQEGNYFGKKEDR